MLGFLIGATHLLKGEAVEEAVSTSVPARTVDLNLKAFAAGYEYALGGGRERHGERAGPGHRGGGRRRPPPASTSARTSSGATNGRWPPLSWRLATRPSIPADWGSSGTGAI